MNLQTVVIVPVKSLNAAKSRLSPTLTPREREALTLNMLRHVLRVAARAPIKHVWVFGLDEQVRLLAEEESASWHADQGQDLNGCLAIAFNLARCRGLAPLYLPGDLPLLALEDIEALVSASRCGVKLILSSDRRGEGTNAILLPVGSPFVPSLGPGSFQRHLGLAQSMGLDVAIYDSAGLALDLDSPEDLDALEKQSPGLLDRLIEDGLQQ